MEIGTIDKHHLLAPNNCISLLNVQLLYNSLEVVRRKEIQLFGDKHHLLSPNNCISLLNVQLLYNSLEKRVTTSNST